jgi:hypothetical protein
MLLTARPSQVTQAVGAHGIRAVSDVTLGDARKTAIPKNDSAASS